MKQWCKNQTKCKEDTEESLTCTAEIDSGNAFPCPYLPEHLITVNNKYIPVKDNGYHCIDYAPVQSVGL